MTSVNDLINEGIGFIILNEDADFSDDGELSHCRTLVDDTYLAKDGNPQSEGLVDCSELGDDHPTCVTPGWYDEEHEQWHAPEYMAGRWAHLRDAHHTETTAIEHTQSIDDALWDAEGKRLPAYGELSYYAVARTARYQRLRCFIEKLPTARCYKVRRDIWAQYKASVQHCVTRGEWYMLLLTKAQVTELMTQLNKKLR
jgi:hypothetical protein